MIRFEISYEYSYSLRNQARADCHTARIRLARYAPPRAVHSRAYALDDRDAPRRAPSRRTGHDPRPARHTHTPHGAHARCTGTLVHAYVERIPRPYTRCSAAITMIRVHALTRRLRGRGDHPEKHSAHRYRSSLQCSFTPST